MQAQTAVVEPMADDPAARGSGGGDSADPELDRPAVEPTRHGFDPVIIHGEAVPPAPDQASEIADALINLIRTYGSLKSRLASSVDPEIASLFLLIRLVKTGPKRAKELAEEVCADQSTVSRQVAALVKSGLIERQADPDDGRASILVPTALGEERVQEHFVHRGLAIEPIIADWPADDRAHFLRLVKQYNVTLELRRDEVLATMGRQPLSERPSPDHTPHHSQPHVRTERAN